MLATFWTAPGPSITLPHQDPNYHSFSEAFYADLPLDVLRFDYDYQRTEEAAKAWAVRTFEKAGLIPGLFGVLHVAERDGQCTSASTARDAATSLASLGKRTRCA